jgi:hypothetical protein
MGTLKHLWILVLFVTGCSVSQKDYDIRSYGAVPGSATLNTKAIQEAIDAAAKAGGGTVVVPAGVYTTGVLHLRSGVELHLDSGATLLGTDKRLAYGHRDASALIVAEGQRHIAITGRGVIDGQAGKLLKNLDSLLRAGVISDDEWQTYNAWHQKRPAERNRPKIINFKNCDSVRIAGITLKNSSDWVQRYQQCTHLVISGITVQSTAFLNNDGIDLVDCQHAVVSGCSINAADDGICLKSESRDSRCQDILVEDCSVRSSASAVKLGTASAGGFRDITIRNIAVHDTYRSAIALECVDGGVLQDVHVSGITAIRTGNAFFIRLGHRNHDSVVGDLKNVTIDHLYVTVPAGKPDSGYPMEGPPVGYPHHVFPASITGIPGHPVHDVTLTDVGVRYPGSPSKAIPFFGTDTMERVPEQPGAYPEFSMFGELPCWGLYARWVGTLRLTRVRITCEKPDSRPAFIFDHVGALRLDSLTLPAGADGPAVVLDHVASFDTSRLQWPPGRRNALRIVGSR